MARLAKPPYLLLIEYLGGEVLLGVKCVLSIFEDCTHTHTTSQQHNNVSLLHALGDILTPISLISHVLAGKALVSKVPRHPAQIKTTCQMVQKPRLWRIINQTLPTQPLNAPVRIQICNQTDKPLPYHLRFVSFFNGLQGCICMEK